MSSILQVWVPVLRALNIVTRLGTWCLAIALGSCPLSTFAEPLAKASDRLDLTRDVVSDFVGYAAALGVAEQDITQAIMSGAFVPDADDLRMVLIRLGAIDCGESFRAILADPYVTPTQINRFDCLTIETTNPGPQHAAWNARFGAPSERDVFVLTTRLYYLMTGKSPDPRWTKQRFEDGSQSPEAKALMAEVKNWSAPLYYLWADPGTPDRNFLARYANMRAAYLDTLPSRLSVENLGTIRLVSDAEAFDATGANWPGSMLAPILHGDWERLDWILRANLVHAGRAPVRNWKENTQARLDEARKTFNDVAAQWALARYEVLGPCGDPTTLTIYTSVAWTEHYLNGILQSEETTKRLTKEFIALSAFSDILVAAPATVEADIEKFGEIAFNMGCESDIRHALEANMLAYFEGREPAFKSGF